MYRIINLGYHLRLSVYFNNISSAIIPMRISRGKIFKCHISHSCFVSTDRTPPFILLLHGTRKEIFPNWNYIYLIFFDLNILNNRIANSINASKRKRNLSNSNIFNKRRFFTLGTLYQPLENLMKLFDTIRHSLINPIYDESQTSSVKWCSLTKLWKVP